MAASKKGNWDEQIKKLKEQKVKKEQGLGYRIDDIFSEKQEAGRKQTSKRGASKKQSENPFVRKVSLDELIDRSRAAKGEKPIDREKKTPFISREKEKRAPEITAGRK